MAPKKIRCCVPYCSNVQENSRRQFFRIATNVENRWRTFKTVTPKFQLMYCCDEHFDLPNDAVNYIRYKYCPDTKLKLRPNILPHRKLPINVCRFCLQLIYSEDDLVDISEKKGNKNRKIVITELPNIDLLLTLEPVVCRKCFDPLEQCYILKQTVLKSEAVIVKCIKSVIQKSPKRFQQTCKIDLFDEYNDINEFLKREKVTETTIGKEEAESKNEEIVIQLENEENDIEFKYNEGEKTEETVENIDQQDPLLITEKSVLMTDRFDQ
ncbi:hypothetical protein ABEB36_013221 [Hypothenemus hampei]|uniref:ZAD domain-containing protein n=1 Tax=Hypothenemus hampei TaxID=57062 RepID=A0ABD1E7H2_HYPHA